MTSAESTTSVEPTTSVELYNALRRVFDSAEARIRTESGHTKHLDFHIHAGNLYKDEISFSIRSGYASSDVEVRGRDFWDCVDEMIRRLQFASRQDSLRLGPPTIDEAPITLGDVAS